jgi:hypothetical protein
MGSLNTNVFNGIEFKGVGDNSVGGAVGFNKEAFIRVGMENENYFSHAPEDQDRAIRFKMLGKFARVNSSLYHLDHWCGKDSKHNKHDNYVINNSEIRRIKSIQTKEEMMAYVSTWPWRAKYMQALNI